MSPSLQATLIGFAAGAGHVLTGTDHLAVVAPLAVSRRREAWRTGLRWGLGHAGGVTVIGVTVMAFRDALPLEEVTAWSEWTVGLSLVAVGLWALTAAVRLLQSSHVPHRRTLALEGREKGAAFIIGVLHGTAGAGHVLGVLPALALPTKAGAVTYLLFFAAGTVAAMTGYAAALGQGGGRLFRSYQTAYAGFLAGCSTFSIGVGGHWLGVLPVG